MRHSLHVQLRLGIDFDCIDEAPDDAIEEIPPEQSDVQQRGAKRRRIEKVATQYLRGRAPVILSARLRGPFNKNWTNPWVRTARENGNTSTTTTTTTTTEARSGCQPARNARPQNVRSNVVRKGSTTRTQPQCSLPSPETSRAVEDILKTVGHASGYQDRAEAPPPSLPTPELDGSGPTEFFSAEADATVISAISRNNADWLRRPSVCEERTPVPFTDAPSDNPSPTRCRNRKRITGAQERLQLAPQTLSKRTAYSSPARVQPFENRWRPSASATMVISSPAKYTNTQFAQLNSGPAVREQGPHLEPSEHAASNATVRPEEYTADDSHARVAGTEQPAKLDILTSAERCTQGPAIANTTSKRTHRMSSKIPKESISTYHAHRDPVASAAPALSTRFTYKRGGVSKQKGRGAGKSKPRPMTFDSSPVGGKDLQKPSEALPTRRPTQEDRAPRPSVYDVPWEGIEAGIQSQPFQTSRGSEFSTQAAMRLALLEFQGGTSSSPAPEISQHWHSGADDRPQQMTTETGAAATPFRAFNAELDKVHPPDTALQASPISTQDLFTAASPFAISTMKKTAARPQGSSLKFSVFAGGSQSVHACDGSGAKSSTPSAQRIPLKERNSKVSFCGAASDASKESSSTFDGPRMSRQDIELPLDLRTSFDDLGDLDFADKFLRNLPSAT